MMYYGMRETERKKRRRIPSESWRTVGIRPIRNGTRRRGEEEEEAEEIQDINTYTNTNLIPPRRFRSARYPITHKALITQLISIYLITPSLPGTISTGPGRESLPASLPAPPPPHNLPRFAIIRPSLSPAVLSIPLANRRHAPAIRIPAECESLAWTCAVNAARIVSMRCESIKVTNSNIVARSCAS